MNADLEAREPFLLITAGRTGVTLGSRLRPRLASDGLDLYEAAAIDEALHLLDLRPPAAIAILLASSEDVSDLQDLRERSQAPLIAIMPQTADESDRLLAFDYGADDVMLEPISTLELLARIRAIRRRAGASTWSSPYRYGPLVVDVAAHEVRLRGQVLALSPQEFSLLAHLARHPHRTLTRRELLASAWDGMRAVHDRATVTEHVRRLRRKFDALGEPGDRWITTVHGVGYRFDPPTELPPRVS